MKRKSRKAVKPAEKARLRRVIGFIATLFGGVFIGLLINALWERLHRPNVVLRRAAAYVSGGVEHVGDSTIVVAELFDAISQDRVYSFRVATPRYAMDSALVSDRALYKFELTNDGPVAAHNIRIPIVPNVPGTAELDANAEVAARLLTDSSRRAPVDVIVLDALPPYTTVVLTYTFSPSTPYQKSLPALVKDISIPIVSIEELGAISIPDTLIPVGHLISLEMREKPGGSSGADVTLLPYHFMRQRKDSFVVARFAFDTAYWHRIGYGPTNPKP